MAINSHIQLPNSILKYFRDESDSEKKVWYLDISSGSIMKAASNKIGTSKDTILILAKIFGIELLKTRWRS